MTAHIQHSRIVEHGLVDDCARCVEIARDPFIYLDDGNLRELVARTRLWMRDEGDCYPRSDTERDAMRLMETTLRRITSLQMIGALGDGNRLLKADTAKVVPFPSPGHSVKVGGAAR